MVNNTVKATTNPTLANSILDNVLNEEQPIEKANIKEPYDTLVNLPAGYITPSGEVIKVAEVRELNGRDEELISKADNMGKVFTTVLNRGVVKIGETPATEELLDELLAGDRDALMLGIYRATFGNTAPIPSYCNGCKEFKTVEVDIDTDINIKELVDPINDRGFTYKGTTKEYKVLLPNGKTQKEMAVQADKTYAELTTLLLERTVIQIDDSPVLGKFQVQNMGIVDRKNITLEISKRSPGPLFDSVTVTCPDCTGEVVVPINLGALFQF
jgi:hypothetical protein